MRGTARVVGGSPLPGVNGNLVRWALQWQARGTPWVGAGTQSCGAPGCRPCTDLSPSEHRDAVSAVSQLAFVGAALKSITQVHVSVTRWAEKTLNCRTDDTSGPRRCAPVETRGSEPDTWLWAPPECHRSGVCLHLNFDFSKSSPSIP